MSDTSDIIIGASEPSQTIGILGGSFNPVHIGHLMIASYLVQWGYVDKIWLTLSPRSPFKADSLELIPDIKRLAMLNTAIKGSAEIDVCDIELSLPTPSYTINTLEALETNYPGKKFKLIIGSDNWAVFNKWKRGDEILERFGVIVYPRPGYPVESHADGMELINAPTVNISSTFIRKAISKGRNMDYFLPAGVYKYIVNHKLYISNQQ